MTPKTDQLVDEMERVAAAMRLCAREGFFDGRMTDRNQRYIERCRRLHAATRTVLIFTRDVGHHSSGWFKNPDYERCLHLSMSVAPSTLVLPDHLQAGELDRRNIERWVRAFFGDAARYAWAESPKSPEGKSRGVLHWRVFCDEAWRPILPRGEVYSRELTEAGWQSASELGVVIETAPGVDPS